MVSKNPPSVRAKLRKEVNFGCPVPACGSPYLMYHHFDPPWHVKHHNNLEGMIALCRDHAPEADSLKIQHGGAFTEDQLRELKKNPFIRKGDVKGRFSWLRREIICMPGGNIIYNPDVILEIRNEKMLWMEKDDEGYYRLNIIMKDTQGNAILEIRNNDWIAETEGALDIICPPSGKILGIKSKDGETEIYIRFDDITINEFKSRLSVISESWVVEIKRHNKEELKHLREEWKNENLTESERQARLSQFKKAHDHTLDYVKRLSQEWPDTIVGKIGKSETQKGSQLALWKVGYSTMES